MKSVGKHVMEVHRNECWFMCSTEFQNKTELKILLKEARY